MSRIEYPPNNAVVDVFTVDGTWEKPSGASLVIVQLIGGGHGGGSGGVGDPGETDPNYGINGGLFGPGGFRADATFVAGNLPATVAVTVGQGGSGAAGVSTSDTTTGPAGSVGTDTLFGALLRAAEGSNSQAFSEALRTAGAGGVGGFLSNAGANNPPAPPAGGEGVHSLQLAGGAAATTEGASGSDGAGLAGGVYGPGSGGGGGYYSTTGNGGDGGDGADYGAGGGGGGACYNGNTSGAGGNGAPGIAIVTTIF